MIARAVAAIVKLSPRLTIRMMRLASAVGLEPEVSKYVPRISQIKSHIGSSAFSSMAFFFSSDIMAYKGFTFNAFFKSRFHALDSG